MFLERDGGGESEDESLEYVGEWGGGAEFDRGDSDRHPLSCFEPRGGESRDAKFLGDSGANRLVTSSVAFGIFGNEPPPTFSTGEKLPLSSNLDPGNDRGDIGPAIAALIELPSSVDCSRLLATCSESGWRPSRSQGGGASKSRVFEPPRAPEKLWDGGGIPGDCSGDWVPRGCFGRRIRGRCCRRWRSNAGLFSRFISFPPSFSKAKTQPRCGGSADCRS